MRVSQGNKSVRYPFCTILFSLILFLSLFPVQSAQAGQVTLAWDPNSEPDLAGYEIYYGTASRNYSFHVDVGNVTTYTLTGLQPGVTYYFAATAYSTQGLESDYSNEVVYTVPPCSYTLSPTSASFPASGGSGSISVNTQSGCNWNTSGTPSWISILSGSGTGNGTMSYTVAPNTGTTDRFSTLTVAGQIFSVSQKGVAVFTVTASAGTGGTITPAGGVTVPYGGSQTFSIAPAAGYKIAQVLVDGVSVGAVSSYTFSSVTADHTISAVFTAIPTYTLTVSKTGTGSGVVTTSPAGTSFVEGTVVTLTAQADTNSVFAGWSGACSGTSATCQVTMNGNVSVTAQFNPAVEEILPTVTTLSPTFVQSTSAQLNGAVNPNGSPTTYYFQWGKTRQLENTTVVQSAGSGMESVLVSAVIKGLQPRTLYYYRLVAVNSAGKVYGATKVLLTQK